MTPHSLAEVIVGGLGFSPLAELATFAGVVGLWLRRRPKVSFTITENRNIEGALVGTVADLKRCWKVNVL